MSAIPSCLCTNFTMEISFSTWMWLNQVLLLFYSLYLMCCLVKIYLFLSFLSFWWIFVNIFLYYACHCRVKMHERFSNIHGNISPKWSQLKGVSVSKYGIWNNSFTSIYEFILKHTLNYEKKKIEQRLTEIRWIVRGCHHDNDKVFFVFCIEIWVSQHKLASLEKIEWFRSCCYPASSWRALWRLQHINLEWKQLRK